MYEGDMWYTKRFLPSIIMILFTKFWLLIFPFRVGINLQHVGIFAAGRDQLGGKDGLGSSQGLT